MPFDLLLDLYEKGLFILPEETASFLVDTVQRDDFESGSCVVFKKWIEKNRIIKRINNVFI